MRPCRNRILNFRKANDSIMREHFVRRLSIGRLKMKLPSISFRRTRRETNVPDRKETMEFHEWVISLNTKIK